MTVAYDGAAYHGFAYQGPELPTVASILRRALRRRLGQEPEITCAGRTDAGVHAWGQVISFDVDQSRWNRVGAERLVRSINKEVSPSIVVRSAAEADPGFDARHSARERRYRYTVRTAECASPFTAATSWWVPETLDLAAMNRACQAILGEHDFSSFCRRPDADASLVRRITGAEWLRVDVETVRFEVRATAFCHQMVRALTGMLVEIGRGRRSVAAMGEALAARDRSRAAALAPPQGLCLWEVVY